MRYVDSVKKDLGKIDRQHHERIKKAIESLKEFPDISNIRKLSAHPLADYRLRVGEYRVLFDVYWESMTIYVLKIGHRQDIY
ncbi:type II toxin-antitoxin system RelE/ParE family toxin [Candidatus Poribacteria bacterium]|nr:type II toxin-antitoxin system RelE/ParE family toxin [Candidatus Poribacteria bacterium]